MGLLALLNCRILVAQIVGAIFALLAAFSGSSTTAIDQGQVVAVAMLVIAAITAIVRFGMPGEPAADAKAWWQSRTIWVQTIAALFAAAELAWGVIPADQGEVVSAVMLIVNVITACLRVDTTRPLR